MGVKVPVYLAGSSREGARVRRYADALEAAGTCELITGWFRNCEKWAGLDHALDDKEQEQIAKAHIAALHRARIVWVLWPDRELETQAREELGIAIGLGARRRDLLVVASGERVRRSVYTSLGYRTLSDATALETITRHAHEVISDYAALSVVP